ncbi:aminopeptidase N [Microbulbifer donghaiensis]|uniref:Aminopeptidase N n=1 Tax=Microbulbifer donghaiensis TaxID=494016 RepID=A0A1M5FL36_9GAMM|nr:aminopeptidase N [Microbulbifer donghaiensis]SHF92139.1 aminopeptidase N [Microbulbifer donghaiensis]
MKNFRKFAATLLCGTLLASCGPKTPPSDKPVETETAAPAKTEAVPRVARPDVPGLTAAYAALRKLQIADVDYKISLDLDSESESFSGRLIAETEIARPLQQALTIDFTGGEVQSVSVNGQEIPFEYNGYFIRIAPEQLQLGPNSIAVDYTHPYSTDGSGLHRFKDPQDGNVYLYTHFEPYKANRFAPMFDQPDLKASYTIDVKAPADWQVVTTTREDNIEDLADGRKHWHFPATKKFSTYILPLHAGPFVVWESKAGDIPLRLMARKTLAPNVKPQDWFTFTQQSFDFFQKYYGIEYPFGKYDQLIVPDFTIGAMENVAAVTFNEAYVSRGEKTQAQRQKLANVIAHEMAHMWFGDLVTMKWWNGLWLKESFATYMASLALATNSEFDDVWENFYLRSKQSAYQADQLPTTHPIEVPVPNTAEAFSNFDSITYGKGGSVLEQLPHYLGKEGFRQGVSSYLTEFSYGNAELKDFMEHLGKAANKDMEQWTQNWLYKAGVNTISATFMCTDDKITQLTIMQTAPKEHPTLREQKIQLGIYRLQDNIMTRVAAVPVTYSGARTPVKEAKGLPCPQILNLNDEDWAYVKTNLDEKSVGQITRHITAIESSFTRLMLWQSLFDSVTDAKWPLDDWITFALNNAGAESNINVIRLIGSQLEAASAYAHRFDVPGELRTERLEAIENFVWAKINSSPAGSDAQKTWFETFTQLAHTDEALNNAAQLLSGELEINGLPVDQDMRWQLIVLLNRHQLGDYAELVEAELQTDNTDRARNYAISARAIRPTLEVKKEWLDNILNKRDQYKLSQIRAAASALFPPEQLKLYRDMSTQLFAAVPKVSDTQDTLYNKAYAMLFPIACSKKEVAQYDQTLKQHNELMPALGRVLKDRRQQSEMCLAMERVLKKPSAN